MDIGAEFVNGDNYNGGKEYSVNGTIYQSKMQERKIMKFRMEGLIYSTKATTENIVS